MDEPVAEDESGHSSDRDDGFGLIKDRHSQYKPPEEVQNMPHLLVTFFPRGRPLETTSRTQESSGGIRQWLEGNGDSEPVIVTPTKSKSRPLTGSNGNEGATSGHGSQQSDGPTVQNGKIVKAVDVIAGERSRGNLGDNVHGMSIDPSEESDLDNTHADFDHSKVLPSKRKKAVASKKGVAFKKPLSKNLLSNAQNKSNDDGSGPPRLQRIPPQSTPAASKASPSGLSPTPHSTKGGNARQPEGRNLRKLEREIQDFNEQGALEIRAAKKKQIEDSRDEEIVTPGWLQRAVRNSSTPVTPLVCLEKLREPSRRG